MQAPDTKPSLILRLRNLDDLQAWNEFAEIYEPLVFRLAGKLGMQHADALEAKQEVMLHLAKVVESWQPQPGGTFRGWLYRVARNVMIRHMERVQRGPKATGDNRHLSQLREVEAASEVSSEFDSEFQRLVFAWARETVRQEVEPVTWQAFWLTFADGVSVADAAESLGISKGNVYVARSRVMKRLRESVQRRIERYGSSVELIRETELRRE